ncbi:MAG: DUF6259 domain-containing protein [Thermogutta sp.]
MRELTRGVCFGTFLALGSAIFALGDEPLLVLEDVPSGGMVCVNVDLGPVLKRCGLSRVAWQNLRVFTEDNVLVPAQFIPEPFTRSNTSATGAEFSGAGILILRLPEPPPTRLVLRSEQTADSDSDSAQAFDGKVSTPYLSVEHNPGHGGFFEKVRIGQSALEFPVRFADRVHHAKEGSFSAAGYSSAEVKLLSRGPLGVLVRTQTRYVRGEQSPTSQPQACYDWFYFYDLPVIWVRVVATQAEGFRWNEHHFLEIQFSENTANRWMGGEPLQEGTLTRTAKSHPLTHIGMVRNEQVGLGIFCGGSVLVYDSPGGDGHYIQAHGDRAWQPWETAKITKEAYIFVGEQGDFDGRIREVPGLVPKQVDAIVTTREIHDRLAAARAKLSPLLLAATSYCERTGHWEDALRAAEGTMPEFLTGIAAGNLSLVMEKLPNGLKGPVAYDVRQDRLLVREDLPLFSIRARHAVSMEELVLSADAGWNKVTCQLGDGHSSLKVRWQDFSDARLKGIAVEVEAIAEESRQAIRWRLKVENESTEWSIWSVVFPQVAIAEPGRDAWVVYPKGVGIAEQGAWERALQFRGRYPSGWVTMQFVGAYAADNSTGLYLAVHDPWGSTKEIQLQSRPEDHIVTWAVEHPAENMGQAGNHFELPGEAVFQAFAGDWFDMALIYRDWVRREARWYPKLGADGREDTALWMRELCLWALGGGAPADCVERVKRFAEYFGVPCGFHWYNWHQIPFDNDYPHYFPTKEGFAEAVAELQKSGVHVMPYINGRLWDTRDRGLEDFEFSSRAKPAVSKNEVGEPYREQYSSKESDGSPVSLGVMCPSTSLWQETVQGIVARLFSECGVHGVYIDQIAAASPTLCFDASHGHPLGGGHWWTTSYWQLLEGIRKTMPSERMITTECNAEPYIRWFDGYLSWHWQYPNQVPLFPAVYGGTIQMFGRYYGGTGSGLRPTEPAGRNRDIALRMRASQQLVFGEQLGWINPAVVDEPQNASFLKKLVLLRSQAVRFFYAGEMVRPPRVAGNIPQLRADWQWQGSMWVTTDAVFTGAWAIPRERKAIAFMVNAAEEELTVRVEADTRQWGLNASKVRTTCVLPEGRQQMEVGPSTWSVEITLPPCSAQAWEFEAIE